MRPDFKDARLQLATVIALAGRMDEAIDILDEPSAAALANRFQPGFTGIVGIYDFGGGTFDFSIVDVSQGDFRVLATAGDTWLGGDDFDRVLADAAARGRRPRAPGRRAPGAGALRQPERGGEPRIPGQAVRRARRADRR